MRADRLIRLCASAYVAFVMMASCSANLFALLAWPVLTGVIYCIFTRLGGAFKEYSQQSVVPVPNIPVKYMSACVSVGVTIVALLAYMAYAWKTGRSETLIDDALIQWREAETSTYRNHYPYLHTFIFMGLIRPFSDSARVVVFMHCLLLASAFGFMAWILLRSGVRMKLVITVIMLTALSPMAIFQATDNGRVKDTAFAAVCILAVALTIEIVRSRGEWLSREKNAFMLCVILVVATMFRHNGLFFTIPLLAVVCVCYCKGRRNVVVLLLLSFALGILFVRIPLRYTLHVKPFSDPHTHLFVESMGLPLSMMGCVYKNNPETMPPSAKEILESFVDGDCWKSDMFKGDFNSVKLTECFKPESAAPSWARFIPAFASAVIHDPQSAWWGFRHVTRVVWQPFYDWGGTGFSEFAKRHSSEFYVRPLGWLLCMRHNNCCGWISLILAIMLALLPARRDMLLLCLPPFVYNLLTMFLLSTDEARFFFFSFAVFLPTCLLRFWKR